MILALLAFIAGLLTVLAPCVLPMIPIILLGSIEEKGYRRPVLVILSLCISILIFTLLLKVSTIFLGVPEYIWKYLSGGIIILLGIIYIFPRLWQSIGSKLHLTKSNTLLQSSQNIQSKTLKAIATGAALGPVFSSCSPTYAFIVATVFPLSVGEGILYTTIYVLGVGTLFFIIAIFGQKLIRTLRIFADEKGIFHKTIGVVFFIIGIGIISGYDKKLESFILDHINVSFIEQSIFDKVKPELGK